MQCNIDSRGRKARLTGGIFSCVLAVTAVVIALFMLPRDRIWLWIVALGLGVVGVFQIFEGIKGWCALRAIGFRTKV